MAVRIIRLCYRKVINAASTRQWDKLVFEATYKEYYMQAQQFDQEAKYQTFSELITNVPRADQQMHYLVSTAAAGYLKQLNERIPDVPNLSGKPCIPFKKFKFEILQSNRKIKDHHSVLIQFYSEPLLWLDSIGNQLIIALGEAYNGGEVETEMINLIPGLSVHSYKLQNNNDGTI
ncbi:MAG TPA: hypothetical protein VIM65_17650 [Cyclobacteriaceae bacterium]